VQAVSAFEEELNTGFTGL